jgi:hypothetical protein
MTNQSQFGILLSNGRIEAVLARDNRSGPQITFTSTKDVGMAIASIARYDPQQLQDRITISGDSCTLQELAQTWEALTQRPVQLVVRPLETYHAGSEISKQRRFAAGKGYMDLTRQHSAWVNNGEWRWTTIEQYLARNRA